MIINVKALRAEAAHLLSNLADVKKYALIGSAMYLPDPNDIDFAVLIDGDDAVKFATDLEDSGWGMCGDYDTGKDALWCAIRKGKINLMITRSQDFYDKYLAAMEVCKALHLIDKRDRIAVCAIVRDGKKAWETEAYSLRRQASRSAEEDGEL